MVHLRYAQIDVTDEVLILAIEHDIDTRDSSFRINFLEIEKRLTIIE